MPGLKLNHISKRGHSWLMIYIMINRDDFGPQKTNMAQLRLGYALVITRIV